MADDLSLLFRIRGDSSGALKATAETRAAVAQLRQSFGPQLTQTVTVANKTFTDLGDNLNNFVAQRVPLVGGAIVRVTDSLKGLSTQSPKAQKAVASVADSIQSIATQSGKTGPQIASFLAKYIQLEGQSKRNEAAFKFFGGSVDLIGNKTAKFVPELEKVGAELAAVSGRSVAAGSSIAAMAGPIGIAVLALAALIAGAVVVAKELFDLTKRVAAFQGKMFDLAQQTGIAVETLSALEVEAKKTGGSIDTIAQSMFNFQRKLDDAQDPLSKTAEQFRKFGIDTSDTETSLRSAFAALARMPEGFAQTNAAAELFGARGGKQVLAILKETNGDLDATTKRLRALGILITDESARAADKFNDELELLNFQVRSLSAVFAKDLIPVMADAVRSTGDLVASIRPLLSLLGSLSSVVIRPAITSLKALGIALGPITGDWTALANAVKEANEAMKLTPVSIPALRPVPLPQPPTGQQVTSEAVNDADAVLATVRRKVAEHNQALDAQFQQGRKNRQQQADETINLNKQVLQAEVDRIDALLAQKEQEIKALDEAQRNRGEIASRDSEQYRAITAQIVKLQQERRDKESEFNVTSRALRAKAAKERADSRRNQIANETDLLVSELDAQIKAIDAALERSTTPEADLTTLEAIEREKIKVRLEGLEEQKRIGFLSITEQQDLNNQIKQLNQERDRLDDEQRARRLERERDTAERTREILISNIDTLLDLENIAGERRIATIQALADQRVITEEDAARRILKIRLDLLDDEIGATEAKLEAAKSITDKDERIRTQADLNNQLKVLKEQRVTIESEGNRAVDDARQEDLDNERRYADELKNIRERTRDIERDTAQEVIRLMVLNFARRKDIIRAQRDLELQEEEDRHQRATDSINAQKREVDEQIKVLETYLEAFKANTQAEIEERNKIVESLEKLRQKREELNRQQEAENERSQTTVESISVEAELEIKKPDAALRDAFNEIGESLTNLAGKFAEVIGAGEEFAAMSGQIAQQIGGVLAGAFDQFANAIGQTVQNWVLLGETGPAVMRKILAQALASLAAEAAVQAIKELALGFATLFFDPGESAAHFTAAALWGSIAGVAAVAGRSVAGDLFKPKSSSSGSGTGSSDRGARDLNPLELNRNQPQQIKVVVVVQPDGSKFGQAVTAHILDDGKNAGPIREFFKEDRSI